MKGFGIFKRPVRQPKTKQERWDEGVIMAFARGEAAARRGKPITANPYKDHEPDTREAWNLGWRERQA